MPARKRENLLRWKRRVDEDGEDDGSVVAELPDDSQSDESGLSDEDDADNSDLSDSDNDDSAVANGQTLGQAKSVSQFSGAVGTVRSHESKATNIARSPTSAKMAGISVDNAVFATEADTEAMMNGMDVKLQAHRDNGLNFETLDENSRFEAPKESMTAPAKANLSHGQTQRSGKAETPTERRRREHEEYKKKRDSDPAFIPNRGAFFMHDHRSLPGSVGYRASTRARGRGKLGGLSSRANPLVETKEPISEPWAHDLHHTVNEADNRSSWHLHGEKRSPVTPFAGSAMRDHNPHASRTKAAQTGRIFSRTVHVANVQIRILLPGMSDAITFSAVPVKQHTKLPNHRPPLRRDKPVRVSLPDQAPRYIFPSTDKSFIFIPRALRPNHQGFGRGKSKGPLSTYGTFSSRRTSAYGGSIHSSSVVLSRRSSLAREVTRENIVSPSGSTLSRSRLPGSEGIKPVVRLPQGLQHPPNFGQIPFSSLPGAFNPPLNANYNFPPNPEFRENWSTQIPMHQPRPQKAVSVAGIEPSASSQAFHVPQPQEQQPFHQQMPPNIHGQNASGGATLSDPYSHNRQVSFSSQAGSVGTPLSNIPERAIHAPAFQPVQQSAYAGHAQHYPTQMAAFYYPPPVSSDAVNQRQFQPYTGGVAAASGMMAPVFMPGSQGGAYVMSPSAGAAPPVSGHIASGPNGNSASINSETAPQPTNMVAHESNGMVYYYDPSQIYQSIETYHPQNTTAPFAYTVTPGLNGLVAASSPGPNFYYPQSHMAALDTMYLPAS